MAKVLKVVKADKTIHIVPLAARPQLQAQNNLLPEHLKWKITEIDEKEANALPWKEQATVVGVDAKVIEAKDAEIARLRAELAKAAKPKVAEPSGNEEGDKKSADLKADEAIAEIAKLNTVEAVNAFVANESRVTVIKASEARIDLLQ